MSYMQTVDRNLDHPRLKGLALLLVESLGPLAYLNAHLVWNVVYFNQKNDSVKKLFHTMSCFMQMMRSACRSTRPEAKKETLVGEHLHPNAKGSSPKWE